ncbi:MAG TPA: acyltransferase [Opitutaceae bacterium]|nr:acyltransferase [Opitutaceae bacterium]
MNANASPAGRDNAFDLIRLLLAVLVVYGHAYQVGGFGDDGFAHLFKMQTNAGPFAVTGFFGISGFLVTRSFALRADAVGFIRARLLRILPGFYLALVFTAFCIAPLVARHNPAAGPWDVSSALRYVWHDAGVRITEPNVGDVLRGLPVTESINGSLWTLFPELCCYGLVLALGALGLFRTGRVNVLLLAGALLMLHVAMVVVPRDFIIAPVFLQLSGWSPYVLAFTAGSAAYCYKDEVLASSRSWAMWLVATLVLLYFGGWSLLGPVALTLGLIQAAHAFRITLPVDLSYGTYLLHFPVLQLMAALQLNRHGVGPYFAAALIATGALAALSWFAVERPFLRLKA